MQLDSVEAWSDAFAAYEATKTAAAMRAATAPYVTVTEHLVGNLLPIATPWSSASFGGPFYVRESSASPLPTCSLVFVRSANGNTVATDPASLGGGATDYHVIYEGLSRVAAHAVLVGAQTARAGKTIFSVWHPEMVDLRSRWGLARHPTQVIATRRGVDLDRGLLFNVPEIPVILLTQSAGAIAMDKSLAVRPWIRLVVVADQKDLGRAFVRLRDGGIHRISCVGGRSLAGDLLAEQLVDDLYLTTAPRDGGTADTPLPAEALDGDVVLEKHGTGDDFGVMFQHFDLRRRRHPA